MSSAIQQDKRSFTKLVSNECSKNLLFKTKTENVVFFKKSVSSEHDKSDQENNGFRAQKKFVSLKKKKKD